MAIKEKLIISTANPESSTIHMTDTVALADHTRLRRMASARATGAASRLSTRRREILIPRKTPKTRKSRMNKLIPEKDTTSTRMRGTKVKATRVRRRKRRESTTARDSTTTDPSMTEEERRTSSRKRRKSRERLLKSIWPSRNRHPRQD
jgi:hypothetical protein